MTTGPDPRRPSCPMRDHFPGRGAPLRRSGPALSWTDEVFICAKDVVSNHLLDLALGLEGRRDLHPGPRCGLGVGESCDRREQERLPRSQIDTEADSLHRHIQQFPVEVVGQLLLEPIATLLSGSSTILSPDPSVLDRRLAFRKSHQA
jgi:hypothetical protein